MSDYNSSLPVRTETNGDVVIRLVDGATTSQYLAVDAAGLIGIKLHDGSGTSVTSQVNGAQQALDVGINVAGVQIDPRQIRALTAADVVTVDQGTSPWIVKDQADGPVSPGAVASFSQLAGGQYNLTPIVLADTQQAALQLTASGKLLVSASLSNDTNYGTVGANTIRTAAQIGNATGAADFNAGATGAQTLRVEANQGAPNTNANAWFTRLTDGTNNSLLLATGELTVAITQPLPAGTNSIGTVLVSNLPTTVDTNYGVVGANTLRSAAQIGNATGAADFNFGTVGAQTLRVASEIGNATGAANFNNGATGAQTLRVAANLAIGGADVTVTNPVPVVFSDIIGTPINDFKDAASIAAAASDNHDYTVTAGKTLYLNQIESSASGKAKMQLAVETGVATGVFTIGFVQFNSTATPDMSILIQNAIPVAAGVRVRVTMTNRDNQSQDTYSSICGYEI